MPRRHIVRRRRNIPDESEPMCSLCEKLPQSIAWREFGFCEACGDAWLVALKAHSPFIRQADVIRWAVKRYKDTHTADPRAIGAVGVAGVFAGMVLGRALRKTLEGVKPFDGIPSVDLTKKKTKH